MKITDLAVDGFGGLSQVEFPAIGPGVNVLSGPTGSGKTTLAEFIRGVFGGFLAARRAGYLPPRQAGSFGGGSVGVEWGSRRLAVIRHARTDDHETLAINVRQGRPDDARELRRQLELLDSDRLRTVFTLQGSDAGDVGDLVRAAREDGIAFLERSGDQPSEAHRDELRRRRHELLTGGGALGRIPELIAIRNGLRRNLEQGRAARLEAMERCAEGRRRLTLEQAATEETVERTHADWQAAVVDLRECEDRLWGRTVQHVVDMVYVQESQTTGTGKFWSAEVAELDRQVEHIRQVLKDLAASRYRVSVAAADVAGSEIPDAAQLHRRQRETLRILELQRQTLSALVTWIGEVQSAGRCACPTVEERAGSAVEELRRLLEVSCQDLSHQQSAQIARGLADERSSLDACEESLRSQLQRLVVRREELLAAEKHPVLSRLAHTVTIERRFCECGEHTATNRIATPRTVTRAVPSERVEEVSSARPGDADLVRENLRLVLGAWSRWQQAIERRNELERAWLSLAEEEWRLSSVPGTDPVEEQLTASEASLAEAQRQWVELLARENESLVDVAAMRPGRVLCDAGEFLRGMSGGRWSTVVVDESGRLLIGPGEITDDADALAALALRLAIIEDLGRRGIEFPLLIDEWPSTWTAARSTAVATTLLQAANRGRQMLLLTSDVDVANLLEAGGAKLLKLDAPQAPVILAEPPVEPKIEAPAPVEVREVARSGSSHVLDVSNSVRLIPSMTESGADRLERYGVSRIRQLLILDETSTPGLLDREDVTLTLMATWRAEADLLCRVPHLDGRDAQLLAACGILSSEELAECGAADLYQRIQRFRGSSPQPWHAWVQTRNTWPQERDIADWIGWSRMARRLSLESDGPEEPEPVRPAKSEPETVSRGRKTRRRGTRGVRAIRMRGERAEAAAPGDGSRRFYLTLDSPVLEAPSIGPKTSRQLQRVGVMTVSHLLGRSAQDIAEAIGDDRLPAATIEAWQHQSRLMCQVVGLRGHDAQLLVTCGYVTSDMLALTTAAELFALINPVARSREGQRMLRSSPPPDAVEIQEWIDSARDSRGSKAA